MIWRSGLGLTARKCVSHKFALQASSSAVAANDVELAELNRKLKSSDEELDCLNKRFDEMQSKF